MANIKREAPQSTPLDVEYTRKLVEEYRSSKGLLEALQKRVDGFKAELTGTLLAHGKPDEKGNLWIEMGDIEIKRERRLTKSFNSAAAEAWSKETGHWDTVKETIEVLSEDKLLGLAWNNDAIQETLKTFYSEKEVWALKA